jgi:hypothetical protein
MMVKLLEATLVIYEEGNKYLITDTMDGMFPCHKIELPEHKERIGTSMVEAITDLCSAKGIDLYRRAEERQESNASV